MTVGELRELLEEIEMEYGPYILIQVKTPEPEYDGLRGLINTRISQFGAGGRRYLELETDNG